ncbi:MAG: hypothetical protein Q4P08_06370, partial [Eubacteriales bacterium]|nr:hypothetical protein [Eubacteriales bacterium]
MKNRIIRPLKELPGAIKEAQSELQVSAAKNIAPNVAEVASRGEKFGFQTPDQDAFKAVRDRVKTVIVKTKKAAPNYQVEELFSTSEKLELPSAITADLLLEPEEPKLGPVHKGLIILISLALISLLLLSLNNLKARQARKESIKASHEISENQALSAASTKPSESAFKLDFEAVLPLAKLEKQDDSKLQTEEKVIKPSRNKV